MRKFFHNWKTSIAGLGSVLTGVAQIVSGHPHEGIGLIITGIGLIAAKDAVNG